MFFLVLCGASGSPESFLRKDNKGQTARGPRQLRVVTQAHDHTGIDDSPIRVIQLPDTSGTGRRDVCWRFLFAQGPGCLMMFAAA